MTAVQSQKTILATDTSSLIVLYKIGALHAIAKQFHLRITPAIWRELQEGSTPRECRCYRSIVEIWPHPLPPSSVIPVDLRGWNSADMDPVRLFYQTDCCAILSEDGRVLRFCKKSGVPHFCSLSLFVELVRLDCLTKGDAYSLIEQAFAIGRYSTRVKTIALEMTAMIPESKG